MSDRKKFLIHIYDQLCNEINRHILVIWQSIIVLTGAIAALILESKTKIPLFILTTIVIVLVSWVIAHSLDSSYWYNRNLAMIANIERQFLEEGDLKLIHYYFGKHRPKNKMISHLKIQFYFAIGIGITSIINLICKLSLDNWCSYIPLITLIIATIVLYRFNAGCDNRYEEFIKNSPGKHIKTEGINYGIGHGGKQ